MLTPRLRRRRRTVDTYVHVELEESTPSEESAPTAENAPSDLPGETAEAAAEAAEEKPPPAAKAG